MLLIKTEQEQALEAFSRGKIVFVSLPTGYGRSQLAGNNNNIILLLRLDKLIFFNEIVKLIMTLYVASAFHNIIATLGRY